MPSSTEEKLRKAEAEARKLRKQLAELEDRPKTMPASEDSERAVLSCALKNPVKCMPVIHARLKGLGDSGDGEAFYYTKHRVVWQSMLQLWQVHETFDLIMLNQALLDAGKLDQAGGPSVTAELLDDVPSVTLLSSYFEVVITHWRRRRLWKISDNLKGESLGGDESRGLFSAWRQLDELRSTMLTPVVDEDVEEVLKKLSRIPDVEPVLLVSSIDSERALTEAGLGAVCIFHLELAGDLRAALEGRWLVAVAENGDSSAALGFVRRATDLAGRLNFFDVFATYGSLEPATMDQLLQQLQQQEVSELVQRQIILELIEGSQLSDEIIYDSIYRVGDRGAIHLLQGRIASRLARHYDLLHAGGFWKWDRAGVYKQVQTKEQVESWITKALASDSLMLPAIKKSNVESVHSLMRSYNFCHPDRLNESPNPYLVNTKTGMLDLLTGEVQPHSRHYRSTTQAPVIWDPDAKCDRWMEWLEQMKPEADEREQLAEMFGYCLAPEVSYHVFFFLYGPGGTGKSTCVDMLEQLVGEENTLALQLEELGNAFTRASLVGKQVYLCGELTRKSFQHIGLIKQISAGEPIYVDVKHQEGFTFRPKGKFVMTSNVHAATPDTSTGFERRFLQINFENQISRDQMDFSLKAKLQAELPGILRWAVEGFQRLHARGHFAHTAGNQKAIAELMRHRNQVASFVKDAGWMDWDSKECWTPADRVLERFIEWCEFWGVKPFTVESIPFSRELWRVMPTLKERAKRSVPPGGGDRIRWFEGVEVPELPDHLQG